MNKIQKLLSLLFYYKHNTKTAQKRSPQRELKEDIMPQIQQKNVPLRKQKGKGYK